MPFPRIVPHQDGAGVIDAVGADVAASRLGERVWLYEAQRGRAFGTAAEYVVVPSQNAVRLPDGVSFVDAACLGVPAMTAHRCLFADGPIAGKTVLVTGAVGGVGQYAVQLAKWGGARVIATYSSDAEPAPAVPFGQMLAKDLTVRFVLVYVMGAAAHQAAIADITAALEAGLLHPVAVERLGLDAIAAAHEAVETGHTAGKVLIDLGSGTAP
jgi:NADPH:quinone reductase-like Zn-dependent oxidoreductase